MTKIETIEVPTKGSGSFFSIRTNGFEIDPQNPVDNIPFYWAVYETEEKSKCVLEGNMSMDKDTYDQWGADDTFVVEWACNELGFTIVTL